MTASTQQQTTLEETILRAVRGDDEAATLLMRALASPGERRPVFEAVLGTARHATLQLEQIREQIGSNIVPAMVVGSWREDADRFVDIDLGGQRLYARLGTGGGDIPEPGLGDEVAVARVDGATPVLVRSLARPYETTGKLGMVVDLRATGDGDWELEIEAASETFTCRATGKVIDAIRRGEVDALGGLPITAVYARGLVWSLRQQKGRAEQQGEDLMPITLADFAGYGEIRRRAQCSLARHLLSLEPRVLTDRLGLTESFLTPTFCGIFAHGLPGTGKTFLTLALVGSARTRIGAPKACAKRAALRLWIATHPEAGAGDRAGIPPAAEALDELRAALARQYAGIAEFGLPVGVPSIASGEDLRALSEALVAGYGVPEGGMRRKLADLDRVVAAGASDFMVLTMSKEHYIRPYVGEGLNALSAQLKRARNHDDLALLCLPEAEILLASRGHRSRYYTDELVSKLLEVLDGPVAARNLFLLADGNWADMVDFGFAGRRLESLPFPGLCDADRRPVIASILARNGAREDVVVPLTEFLLDLVYSERDPLCEVVMVDKSRLPLGIDDVLTPALVQNVVRSANGLALAGGRVESTEDDLGTAWRREMEAQGRRFRVEDVAAILGLDRQEASRIIDIDRRGARTKRTAVR